MPSQRKNADAKSPTQAPPEVMLATEVADYLRISYATVLRMTKAGELNAIRVGREFRYLRSELDKMMQQPARPLAEDDSDAEAAG